MNWPIVLLPSLAAAAATWALTWLVLRVMTHRGIVDTPNERSSHTAPKPHGGGLALIPVILIAWLAVALHFGMASPRLILVLAGAVGLAIVGWLDDLRDLPLAPRLLAQAIAVGLGLYGLDGAGPVFQGLLPPLLDRLVAGLAWLWFVNLFNFMDGIDGISGVEAGSIGLGLFLVGLQGVWPGPGSPLPALLAAATLGFLIWNWQPSKLFLGDVGSVPLGYLIGWLLLIAAIQGQWAAALILPLYYLVDATITLVRRAFAGEKVWRPHRKHFYQRAVLGGASHARISRGVLACNLLLIGCAMTTVHGNPWPGLAAGVVVVGAFLAVLHRWAGKPR